MGFIMLRLARVVRQQYPSQCFVKIPGLNLWKLSWLSGVFPPFVGHFFKRAREPEVKLHHVVYEVRLVSYLFFSFQIWYFRKWIITSIGQSKHMRVTRFNPLWVSDSNQYINQTWHVCASQMWSDVICCRKLKMLWTDIYLYRVCAKVYEIWAPSKYNWRSSSGD